MGSIDGTESESDRPRSGIEIGAARTTSSVGRLIAGPLGAGGGEESRSVVMIVGGGWTMMLVMVMMVMIT